MSRGPLAYAFWHWKRESVPQAEYETAQCGFQQALAADPPAGLLGATTTRLSGAPWIGSGAGYEDWYLVADMAALDQLNEAAVTGSREVPHAAVARLAAGGTAGLYGVFAGSPLAQPRLAYWFAKPPGLSYGQLRELLTPAFVAGHSVLWSRRMTLGPTPEFCLQSAEPMSLPSVLGLLSFELAPVWPPAAPSSMPR